jgi:predicted outer membrane repeat protein
MEYTNASVVNTFFYGRVGHIRMNSLSTLKVNASNFTSGYNDPRLYYPSGSVTRAYYNDGGSISSYLHLNVITIRDSKFLFNRAFAQIPNYNNHFSRGGAIYSLGEVTVINCLFNGNNASQGGAIYSERTVTVVNSNFTGNTGPRDYNHFGGAIFSLSDIIAVNTTFHGNWARNGGATYSSSIVSTGSIFTNNTVNDSSDNFPNTGNGGAIYTVHDVTARSTSFIGNTAVSGSGGAVYIDANSTRVLFFGSSFSNNRALNCGVLSANRLYHINVTMVDSTFSFNNAIGTTLDGGVACFGSAMVKTVNCVFNDNKATSNAGVFTGRNSSIVIDESTFLRNMAQGNGGVMYTNEYQTNYTIQQSIFQRNSATDGGVMYVLSNSNIEIGASTYIENHATDKGGVFYIRGGTLVMDINSNSTFSGNTATLGDVISTCLSDVNVTDFGLEMQPDPDYPQYCSVYDETNAATNGSINTTETTTIESTGQSTTPYETSTHPEGTTPNSQSSTHPEITTDFEKTSKPDTASTTLAATTTTNIQASTHTEVTSESAVSTAPTTPSTTVATQAEMTTPPTTVYSFHEDTTSSTTDDSKTSGGMGILKSTTVEVTTVTNNPKHSTTVPTDNEEPGLERNHMSVTYVSLGISLVSMIATVTVCIVVLLLFCGLWKKVNANTNRTYSLGERRMSFGEDEYSFAVDDSSNIPASQHEEEKHLIPV